MSQGEDVCPSCHAEMASRDATVCTACGFDLKANKKIRTNVGSGEFEPEEEATFCRAGRIPWQVLLAGGAAFAILAFVLAWGYPPEAKRPFFYGLQNLPHPSAGQHKG